MLPAPAALRCRSTGPEMEFQPEHGHPTVSHSASSTHALPDRIIGSEATPSPASASCAQPASKDRRASVDNSGG